MVHALGVGNMRRGSSRVLAVLLRMILAILHLWAARPVGAVPQIPVARVGASHPILFVLVTCSCEVYLQYEAITGHL